MLVLVSEVDRSGVEGRIVNNIEGLQSHEILPPQTDTQQQGGLEGGGREDWREDWREKAREGCVRRGRGSPTGREELECLSSGSNFRIDQCLLHK